MDFKRLLRAIIYSIEGIKAAWRHEASFRLEKTIAAVILTPISFMLTESLTQAAVLLVVVWLVLLIELINSAIESAVDRISEDYHELSGRAKDIGSAAVFLALILCVIVWGLVIWQNYFIK